MTAQPEEPDQPEIPTTGPLSRTCPRCKAPPGTHCTTNTKRPMNSWHVTRIRNKPTHTGRPFAITPELTIHIIDKLTNGTSLRTAAQTAGIAEATLHRWLALGESDHPDHVQFREFREQVIRARAGGNSDLAENIVSAGKPREYRKPVMNAVTGDQAVGPDGEPLWEVKVEWDWRASAWVLERAFSGEWGKRSSLEITGAGGDGLGVQQATEAVSAAVTTAADRVWATLQEARARGELGPGPDEDIVDAEVED